MDTKNKFLVYQVEKKLLKKLKKLALFEKKSTSPERGRLLFGRNTDNEFSNYFFILLLECLKKWPFMFYSNPRYQGLLNELMQEGVSLPNEFRFFDDLPEKSEIYPDFDDHQKSSSSFGRGKTELTGEALKIITETSFFKNLLRQQVSDSKRSL